MMLLSEGWVNVELIVYWSVDISFLFTSLLNNYVWREFFYQAERQMIDVYDLNGETAGVG